MRVLVTGAAGMLGRELVPLLASAGHDVTAVDLDVDITDPNAVDACVSDSMPEAVFHLAAWTDVDGAESREADALAVNGEGAGNVARAAARVGAPLVFVSTDYVFDGSASHPYDEDAPANPRSVYGQSKWAGEEAVRGTNPRHYVVRTAWLFHPEGRNFLNTMLGLAGRASVCVVDDQTGSPTFAAHLAEGIAQLVTTDAYGTYHMAGRGGTTWYELTRTLYRLAGVTTPVEPVTTAEFPRPAPRPRYSVLTTIRAPRILLPPWEEGVAAFVRQRSG